jgi:hypothetical protein
MIRDGWRATLLSGLALGVILLALFENISTGQAAANLLTNGGFEQGFTFRQGCGHVGLGWGCFTNAGQAIYGFYDDQWEPVVLAGEHSQLIEINTKGLGAGTDDRYAGLFQTVRVTPNTAYQIAFQGMIRSTTPESEKLDPWRYRVQFGWSLGRRADWREVDNWVDVGLDLYDDRLAPTVFNSFTAKFIAQEPYITVYARVWKKWGTTNEEIDINLDNFVLTATTKEGELLPLFTPTPTQIISPLQLPVGTLVTALPTPRPAAPDSPLASDPDEITDWPRISGNHVAFSYPGSWQPTANELGANAILDEYLLGIPEASEQLLGFTTTPFAALQPPNAISVSRLTIGGKLGAKWVLQGPTFVGYYYCTEGLDPQSSFCVRVTLPTSNPQVELQLDYLVQSITFY